MGGPVKKVTRGIGGALGGVFGGIGDMLGFGDKIRMPEPPPPPPTVDDAAESQRAADEARRRRGRAASILTSPTGVGSTPVGTKSLLGA